MNIVELLDGIEVLNREEIDFNLDVKNIAINTQKVKEGTMFVCLKGQQFDGHNLKKKAQMAGAVCFVVEKYDYGFNGQQILVKNTRVALSFIARNFYVGKSMPKVIGVTGTNGKTTTTYMVASILKSAGKCVGVIGTEGIVYNGVKKNHNMTTPDPIELFNAFKEMNDAGVEYVVMEVSAHAIYLHKIDAITFSVKALTNITEDHLDFFKNIEAYRNCKVEYIVGESGFKVVNNNDEVGKKIINAGECCSYGFTEKEDVFAKNINEDCSEFEISMFNEIFDVKTNFIGMYNVENALCACAIAGCLGISAESIKNGLESFECVDGRLNQYMFGNRRVIIDFAHTPDAFIKVMSTVKKMLKGKMICVFGCGGNREKEKRPIMGQIASEYCDYIYLTSDNPRYEDPIQICKEIETGIKGQNYEIITDRECAIKMAFSKMEENDILLVLGKGAENYLEINGVKHDYSDRRVVQKLGENL